MMAKESIHRKHFLKTAGAFVLGGLGITRVRAEGPSESADEPGERSRHDLANRMKKDPRSVPQDRDL